MKKSFIFLCAFILLFVSMAPPAQAAYNSELDVDANIAYLISLDKDNTVIYDKNSDLRYSPAAIVKVVTGLLVIENCVLLYYNRP